MGAHHQQRMTVERVLELVAGGVIVDVDEVADEMGRAFPDGLSRDQIVNLVLAVASRSQGAAVKIGA